ncbi:LysR substrate-binding domain-containing protein [Endozoicomonas sp. YOMI1]|uniref:LysR substrate-binding domain-containing protein n=1 Tax=Endozoicomonas sp. YOMI1 TaxID=2828739 RepID=UPI002147F421|nr:LysR substrate-binding domain-containing protein [Endozoicomonas sp. YOMI1]
MAELQEHRSICIQDTSRFYRHGYNLLLENQQVLLVPSFRAAIECLLRGLGATILPNHFARPYIEAGLLVRKEVPELHYNDGCLLAWNQENMGQGLKWVLDWLGSETWLNKVWLQYDEQMPMGYHVP